MSEPGRPDVDGRLEDLYRRHLDLGEAEHLVTRFYSSEHGYRPPAEVGAERDLFSVCLVGVGGDVHVVGDHDVQFPLQSVSKVFAHGQALEERGEKEVLRRVGVKPSAEAFTSLGYDEHNHRPYNPMVNAGAIATVDLIREHGPDDAFERILRTLRCYAGNEELDVDEATFEAERRGADANRGAAYLMRSVGMLAGEVEAVVDLYLRQCSVLVRCRDLAVMAATLANGCVNPVTGERALAQEHVRDVLSVMYTCGMYDFAGEWAYEVGVPAKSGVSGAILAVVPGKGGVGVFSPGLDRYGNSVRGIGVCREISGRAGLHVFAADAEDSLLERPGARL